MMEWKGKEEKEITSTEGLKTMISNVLKVLFMEDEKYDIKEILEIEVSDYHIENRFTPTEVEVAYLSNAGDDNEIQRLWEVIDYEIISEVDGGHFVKVSKLKYDKNTGRSSDYEEELYGELCSQFSDEDTVKILEIEELTRKDEEVTGNVYYNIKSIMNGEPTTGRRHRMEYTATYHRNTCYIEIN